MSALIPQPGVIKNYNLYGVDETGFQKYIGAGGEITLPTFTYMGDTANHAGLMGQTEFTAPGMVQTVNMDIPFPTLTMGYFTMMNETINSHVLIFGSQVERDENTGFIQEHSVMAKIGGMPKGKNFGTMGKGRFSNASNQLIVHNFLFMRDGIVWWHWDLFRAIFIENGIDRNAITRALIG